MGQNLRDDRPQDKTHLHTMQVTSSHQNTIYINKIENFPLSDIRVIVLKVS